MSLEATLDFTQLTRNETQHFVGTITDNAGVWHYDGAIYTKYNNGITVEQSLGISVNAGAVKGPSEAKFVIDITRKSINKLGDLGEAIVDAYYNGAIYGKADLQNNPTFDTLRHFFNEIAPAIDEKLSQAQQSNAMRFGLAAKTYK